MEAIDGLVYGLQVAVQPAHLLAALLGVVAGMVIGLLPGLGPAAGAAVLLPLTFGMSPTAGLIMIAGVYYGVMYGGSATAILLNIPGEAATIVTAIEGHQLAKQGRAGPALFIVTCGSFLAGTLAVVLVTLAAPVFANVGLLFGPAEFFALIFGGLLMLSRMMGGSLAAGLLPMFVGLVLGTVGEEAVTGTYRFTYGSIELTRGFDFVSLAIGLFGVTELLLLAANKPRAGHLQSVRVRDLVPTRGDIRQSLGPWLRGGPIGFLFGLLPGPSATMATFASYRLEKSIAKDRAKFGKGAMSGLAGPEAANNSAATSSIVPVLALGIPFSATLALMLAALLVHGVTPGPLLIDQHPEIFWGVIGSMYLGNILLVLLNIPLIGVWVSFLRTPYHLLVPIVVVIAVAGAFSYRGSYVDLIVVLAAGGLGLLLRRIGYQLAPLLVGFILGPMLERNLREALFLSRGDVTYLVTEPLAGAIWLVVVVVIVAMTVGNARARRQRRLGAGDQAPVP